MYKKIELKQLSPIIHIDFISELSPLLLAEIDKNLTWELMNELGDELSNELRNELKGKLNNLIYNII